MESNEILPAMEDQGKRVAIIHHVGEVVRYIKIWQNMVNMLDIFSDIKCDVFSSSAILLETAANTELLTISRNGIASERDCPNWSSNYDHIFIVASHKTKDGQLLPYDVHMQLEHALHQGRTCSNLRHRRHLGVTLILFQVTARDAKVLTQRVSYLRDASVIHVDFNKNEWQTQLFKDLVMHIEDERRPSLPMADIVTGLTWSHFSGYLSHVLPNLKTSICSSPLYREKSNFLLLVTIVIPLSARTVPGLHTLDSRIQREADIEVPGNDGRNYKLEVYSFKNEYQTYYFTAHMPNTLNVLSQLASVNPGSYPVDVPVQGEIRYLVQKFVLQLNMICNHSLNAGCNKKTKFIVVDDTRTSVDEDHGREIGDAIMKSVVQECESTCIHHRHVGMVCSVTRTDYDNGLVSKYDADTTIAAHTQVTICPEETVHVFYDPKNVKEMLTAMKVKDFVNTAGLRSWEDLQPDAKLDKKPLDPHSVFSRALRESKWCVFVLTRDSLFSGCSLLETRWLRTIHKHVYENGLRVVLVLDGLEEGDVTRDLLPLACLLKNEPNFKETLTSILMGGPITVHIPIAGGTCIPGLAWAFVLNYLQNVTPVYEAYLNGLNQELQKVSTNRIARHCHVVKKLLILVPAPCSNGNIDCMESHRFQYQTTVGAFVDRFVYRLHGRGNEDYLVAVECPNVLQCLVQMSKLSELSGLNKQHLCAEASKFKEFTDGLINSMPTLANKVKLVYFDDCQMSAADVLVEILEEATMWDTDNFTKL